MERVGKYGRFVGCSNYPRCRYTLNRRTSSASYIFLTTKKGVWEGDFGCEGRFFGPDNHEPSVGRRQGQGSGCEKNLTGMARKETFPNLEVYYRKSFTESVGSLRL